MRRIFTLVVWLGGLGIALVSCGKTETDQSNGGDHGAGASNAGAADAGATNAGATNAGASEAGASGASNSAGGAAGSGDSTVASSGAAGAAGAAGSSDLEPSISGLNVLFLGPGTSHGADSEADLISLITDRTGIGPKRVHGSDASAELTLDDLSGANVMIVDDILRAYSATETQLVADWVAGGHGLIVLNGFRDDSSWAAGFGASYAVSYGSTLLADTTPAYVTDFSAHPVVRGVSSLYILGGFDMTTTDATAVPFASLGSATLGLALTHGAGRVVLWGDDWIELSQEINRVDAADKHPTQLFWLNALHWASGGD